MPRYNTDHPLMLLLINLTNNSAWIQHGVEIYPIHPKCRKKFAVVWGLRSKRNKLNRRRNCIKINDMTQHKLHSLRGVSVEFWDTIIFFLCSHSFLVSAEVPVLSCCNKDLRVSTRPVNNVQSTASAKQKFHFNKCGISATSQFAVWMGSFHFSGICGGFISGKTTDPSWA